MRNAWIPVLPGAVALLLFVGCGAKEASNTSSSSALADSSAEVKHAGTQPAQQQSCDPWEKAAREEPYNGYRSYQFGLCLFQGNQFSRAADAFNGAHYLHDDFKPAVEMEKKAWEENARNDGTVSSLTRQLHQNTRDARALLARGSRCFLLHAYSLALQDAESAATLQPDLIAAQLLRAKALVHLGRRNEAISVLQDVSDSDNPDLRAYYGLQLVRAGRQQEAGRFLNVEVDSLTDPDVLLDFAAFAEGRSTDNAIYMAIRATKLDPANALAFYTYGHLLRVAAHQHGHTDQARSMLDESLTRLDESYRLASGQDWLLALIHLERGRVLLDHAWTAMYSLLIKRGEYLPRALDELNLAIEQDPHAFLAYAERGLVYFAMDRPDDGEHDLKIYLMVNPGDRAYLEKRIAWWTELHEEWKEADVDLRRRMAEMAKSMEEWIATHEYCSSDGQSHLKSEGCPAPILR